ncbi:bifunctional D-glycero-beta-D-manno-heptose-7-phosphate kinase/D-glycero-beta-D-manno-heptose 1-phosphate adenylyltransferase HldE [Candidatus Enterovibrio escicola]|uniref:Bifunctional protein HldE n=1 Tax=Candidatus Enterovibrio escicola TaxID=1927127 RepID=A0A2A5T3G5_9GAMM|nr:bifunctional D-glycero-beta-D-manno-heptose-7-phosphate kinase/D-glycero-beta-D-manno-heptose 1-phosphate adenylyltransferase HldE [Candidatus Enterovibrio escacola]PCS22696.1 ADP-heptose synthase [Candidatus Enterovibrio escacola]
MKLTLPDYQRADVLIVGDVILDRYWYGLTGRISPEAPVPVVKINQTEERPGGAANVAMNVAALGGKARLIGLVGQDEHANVLNDTLSSSEVECHFVRVENYTTITKLRVMSRNQQLIRLDFEEDFHNVDVAPLLEHIEASLPHTKVMVLSDYAKGALENVQSMIQLALKAGVPTLVDPKGTDFACYRSASLLTPNMSEFETVVGVCLSEEDVVEKGLALIRKFKFGAMLITRSENGMTLLREGYEPLNLPTLAKEVYDVTGAGDTVISVIAASLAAGKQIEDACALANAAAGVVVGKLGTSTLSTIELTEAVHGSHQSGFGVVCEAQLIAEVQVAKARREIVVMTNGCFDILHAGHVAYLNEAAKLGDYLIVAVNTDESVKIVKGSNRPVNPTDRRMAVLAGLRAVDWVVPFNEETPQRLISKVLPNLLVKGGDYKPEDIAGGEEVRAAGGDVHVLNFEEACSTTEIINLILRRYT